MPVILAGIRVTAVTTVGLVTITALIGRGGLGFFILRGLNRFFWTEVIVAITLSVALAAAIDRVLVLVGRLVAPWAGRRARVGA
jgi:osmoprotectant transport system permease protein